MPSFTEHQQRQAGEPAPARRRSGGCGFLWALLLVGLILVPAAVYFLEFTEIGAKVHRRLQRMTGQTQVQVALGAVTPTPLGTAPASPPVIEKIVEVPVDRIVEKIVEVPMFRPIPDRFVAPKEIDTAQLYGGLMVKTEIAAEQGDTATLERGNDGAYQIEMTLKIRVPKPHADLASLSVLNAKLPAILPDLELLLRSAKISGLYHELYRLKQEEVQRSLTRLNKVPSRHNFFDCETVLELRHPTTQAIALMMQGEMDVVADGSDGDRWPKLDDYITMSDHYQPFTSYGWKKATSTPNPLLAQWQADLKKYEAEYALPGLSGERNRFLRDRIAVLPLQIADMKARSFLIAEADPFIVVPLSFLGRKDAAPFVPNIGDYAVVIYEDSVYPAIVGDAGPSYKMGEASLRVAKQLNEKATVYNRPVSDLKVTYLVFPDSAEKDKQAPDLVKWRARCDELLGGLGGLGAGYELHRWEDLIAKRKANEKTAGEKTVAPPTAPPTLDPPSSASPASDSTATVPPAQVRPAP